MNSSSKKLGIIGETIACNYLIENGYEIIERNWRFKKYEIDIIAKTNDAIIVIEVKTRKSANFGQPEDFVSIAQQKYLTQAINEYVVKNNINLDCMFDVISIVINENKQPILNHLKNAFYPTLK
ncbi:MAG: YraN family protein [Bacteroidetes bacterium]|jgi:putative endonuclease|nr:YraN family protein [Bacteroidota bacterium]